MLVQGLRWRCLLVIKTLLVLVQAQDAAQSPAKSFSHSIAISYEVLGTAQTNPQPLAKIQYDPKSLEYVLSSWTPPPTDGLKSISKDAISSPLVRISSLGQSTTVTGLSSFGPTLSQDINIWLSESGDIISTSVTSRTPPPLSKEEQLQKEKEERLRARGKAVPSKKAEKVAGKKAKNIVTPEQSAGPVVSVNIRRAEVGVQPKLTVRKPLEVNEQGQQVEAEVQPEKSFIQKYWYWLLIGAFLLMSSAGGGS